MRHSPRHKACACTTAVGPLSQMRTFAYCTYLPRSPRPPILSRALTRPYISHACPRPLATPHRPARVQRHASPVATMPFELDNYKLERAEALSAVAAANALARNLQHSLRSQDAITKSDSSPVTVADFSIQAYIVTRLHAAFPNDRFIAEETSNALREDPALLDAVTKAVNGAARTPGTPPLDSADVLATIDRCSHAGGDGARTWVLDPIDGTRGYVAMRQYCIALAFTVGGIVRLGVLGCPNLPSQGTKLHAPGTMPPIVGVVFHAVRGEGSYMLAEAQVRSDATPPPLGKRVHVSDVKAPSSAIVCESVEKGHSSHAVSGRVAKLLQVAAPPVRMDSQAKYGVLSRGDACIFMRFPRQGYVENSWDHAAGAIVVEEAGGKVTDGRGRPLDFSAGRHLNNDDGIVASNGLVHDKLIAAVKEAIEANAAQTS